MFISVTTVPAAGNVALGLAFGVGHEIWGSALQLVVNLTGMAVAGWVTLAIQQAIWTRMSVRRARLIGRIGGRCAALRVAYGVASRQWPASHAASASRMIRRVRRSSASWASIRASTCSSRQRSEAQVAPPTSCAASASTTSVDRQAELLELPRQPDPVQVVLVEGPVPAGGPRRRVQHAATLVEADRVHRHPGGRRELPDPHAPLAHRHTPRLGIVRVLTLDHGPDSTVLP